MSGPRTAADSMRLVLAMVPWIIDHPGASIDRIAERFGQNPTTVLTTLEMLSFVGVPPYSPDALIEVRIEDQKVWLNFADYFSRPLQLSTGQALALLASADALRRIDGADEDGSLSSALTKLAEATGVVPDRQLDIRLGDTRPDRLAEIRAAAAEGRELAITYFNHSKNETTQRTVVPRRVRSAGGAWYVDAYCYAARDERSFRLDRIVDLAIGDRSAQPPPQVEMPPAGEVFRSHGDLPTVTLRLGREQHWVRDSLPIVSLVEIDEDLIEVTLAVASTMFLERLLLQLGPTAQVVASEVPEPDEVAVAAARRVLARYAE
jgi:proteasome accessory factor C